jgi:hypothetical protein
MPSTTIAPDIRPLPADDSRHADTWAGTQSRLPATLVTTPQLWRDMLVFANPLRLASAAIL